MAFAYLTLTNATFGDSLKVIEDYAFYVSHFTSFDLANVEYIGNSAFEASSFLQYITGGYSLKSVGDNAFYSTPITSLCKGNDDINYCENLTYIGDHAFEMSFLPNFKLSYSPSLHVGISAFANIFQLEMFDMSGYHTITKEMFVYCNNLKQIKNSEKVTSIENQAIDNTAVTVLSVGQLSYVGFALSAIETLFYYGTSEPILGKDYTTPTNMKVYVTDKYNTVNDQFTGLATTVVNCNNNQKVDLTDLSCKSCEDGLSTIEGLSMECTVNTSTCNGMYKGCALNACTEFQCLKCEKGKYFDFDTKKCIETCDTANGFHLLFDQITCVKCPENCNKCTESSEENPSSKYTCIECKGGYTKTSKGMCTTSTQCNSTSNEVIIENGTCTLCNELIAGCQTCSDKTTCTKCSGKYRYNSDKKLECLTSCVNYYEVAGTNMCVDDCDNVTQYKDSEKAICFDYPKSCVIYNTSDLLNEQIRCSKCASKYYLTYDTKECVDQCSVDYEQVEPNGNEDGKCNQIVCDDTNCENCTSQSKNICMKCKSPYYLYLNEDRSTKCESTCTKDTHFEKTNNDVLYCKMCSDLTDGIEKCIKCSINENEKKCNTCETGYYVQPNSLNECKTTCPTGYKIGDNGDCEKCADNCISCDTNGKGKCDKCVSSYYLLENTLTCSSTCDIEKGYFKNETVTDNLKCNKCDEYCDQCASKSECLHCEYGAFLFENKCIGTCPVGYFENVRQCSKCKDGNTYKTPCYSDDKECNKCATPSQDASLLLEISIVFLLLFFIF
ncbi:hypothetical protein EIN_453920 [Entamoeba invadens IP1]|uniref:Furin repeat-containing protein n=1 Tax=Entamoeba invadens IP1 TaxID=370355 RepID=L7FP53_ENTIV|nr:hypothetical protein EIN_453920 [Entamoeba invadens IP1]ELP89702.1 hypothetical protein EIN_453920 [Entamoeba invadens IP1]|eukprot:XP_004256473.1 hypothetical protein EIN_453920 [Entamoeba invadens IP1]